MNRAMWVLIQLQRERLHPISELAFQPAAPDTPMASPIDQSCAAGAKVLAMLAMIAAEIAPYAPPLTLGRPKTSKL